MAGVSKGQNPRLFTVSQKEFNREISKELRKGIKTYIDKLDCLAIYKAWNGRCSWCGLPLNVRGMKLNSVHFMLLVPHKAGGKIERENIVTACYSCKYEKHHPLLRYGLDRVYSFNTLPDLIEQLVIKCAERAKVESLKNGAEDLTVRGQLDKHHESIQNAITLLRRQVDNAVAEFVYTLHYNPISDHEIQHPIPVEEESTIGYAVEQMAEKAVEEEDVEAEKEIISDNLHLINKTKRYQILRREE